MIGLLGVMVGAGAKTGRLIGKLRADLQQIADAARRLPRRPRVYFEEWNSPLISGIGWVSELIAVAGGEDCFAELSTKRAARDRIIADPDEVIRRAPDIVIGSWCGKRFQPDDVRKRPGWEGVPAVRADRIYEIKSCDILQPGPACLTDGVHQLYAIIRRAAQ
jgi:iron complex transport system substrate-binding protein